MYRAIQKIGAFFRVMTDKMFWVSFRGYRPVHVGVQFILSKGQPKRPQTLHALHNSGVFLPLHPASAALNFWTSAFHSSIVRCHGRANTVVLCKGRESIRAGE